MNYQATVAGVADGSCTECDTAFNGTHVLDKATPYESCAWSKTIADACSYPGRNGTVTLQYDSLFGGNSWKLYFAATMEIDIGSGPEPVNVITAVYKCATASFNCLGSSEFALSAGDTDARCSNWPATLTVDAA